MASSSDAAVEDELGSALLSAWEAEEAADAAAARRPPAVAARRCCLTALPDPVLLRVLSKLAPDDLCAFSLVSRPEVTNIDLVDIPTPRSSASSTR